VLWAGTYVADEVYDWLDYVDEQKEVERCGVETESVAGYKQEYAACYMLVMGHRKQEMTMSFDCYILGYELLYTLGYGEAQCILG
jgi:hypothetical protein